MWQCNNRFNKNNICRTPALSDDDVRVMFAAACAKYAAAYPQIEADRRAVLQQLGDGKELGKQIRELEGNIREYDILLAANAPDIAPGRVKQLKEQRSQAKIQLDSLRTEQRSMKGRMRQIKGTLAAVIDQTYREEGLARLVLERAIVQADKSISFVFKDGFTCTIEYEFI